MPERGRPGTSGPKPGSTSCNQAGDCDVIFSYAMFRDLEAGETAFSGVAAHRLFGANVAYNGITLNGQAVDLDALETAAAANTITGGADADRLDGKGGADVLHGRRDGP